MSESDNGDDFDSVLERSQSIQLNAISQMRDQIAKYFWQVHSVTPARDTLYHLMTYVSERSQSVSFLTSHGYIWDAEILMRTFTETCSKIWLICFSPHREQPQLITEYWTELEQVHAHQAKHKAQFAEAIFDKANKEADVRVFRSLQNASIFDFGEQNKAERKRLKQKWSFSEIIGYLETRSDDGAPTKGMKALLHMYGMQSHLVHGDNKAMDLITDANNRKAGEKELRCVAQISRIMSDQLYFWHYCQMALAQHFGHKLELEVLKPMLEEFDVISKSIHNQFNASQDNFYSQF